MLQVALLGERTVSDAATGRVRSRSARTTALIAYLALHAGMPQPRGQLAATFWPESAEQQALTNLRRELHQLRRTLGDDPSLEVTATDLTWRDRDSCRVDLRTFHRHRERAVAAAASNGSPPRDGEVLEEGAAALAAFRGELLPGLYDDWAVGERDRLTAQCVELCALVAETAAGAGRWTVALDAARRRVALAPLEEDGHRALVRLHARRGDRAAAVSAYHHLESVLDEELGLPPDAESRRLLADLVATDGSRERPEVGTAVTSVDFVGRRTELAALQGALDTALAGSARTALVTGEPGVGKSRLVSELARAARGRGAVVSSAQCYGTPGRLALAPVADWLAEATLAGAVAGLDDSSRAEVRRLVPTLGGDPEPSRGVLDSWQRYRFFQALTRAFRAPGRPLLLVLENLQWCDEETLDFLAFLLTAEPTVPVLLAVTARAGDVDTGVAGDWVRRMRATGLLAELPVAPFDLAETGQLLRLLSGTDLPEEVVRVMGSATGGFPLYVVEAARRGADLLVADRAPGDLDAVLRARFDQLGPSASQVVGLAAATGRDFDLELLCEASDLDAGAVVAAVDELWRLRILREVRRGYDFSHDLLRTAAYQRVTPAGRWLLHRRLAQALEILHAGRTDQVAAQLADQYARAGNLTRAVDHYHRAALVAARVFAHAEAIRLHEAALALIAELPPGADRAGVEVRTLTAMTTSLNAHRGYSDPQLARTLERTVELAEQLSLREALVDALVGLWTSRFVSGQIRAAYVLAARAVDLADSGGGDGAQSGQAHFAFAGSAVTRGRPQEAREHFALACARAEDEQSLSIGSHPAIHARAWLAHADWLLCDPGRAAANATEAVARARRVDHPYSLAIALAYAAVTWQLLDDLDELVAATEELARLSDRHGFAYYSEWGLVLSGWAQADAAGTTRLETGLANLRRAGAFARMPYWLTLLAQRCADPGRARAVLDAAVVDAEAREDRWWLPEVLRQRAVRFLTGDEAERALAGALALATEQGSVALAERCAADLAAARTVPERRPS
jgi:DNA-binding SARP family transcriptional activator/tetratricopeptide (TPR) repeat protein